MAPQDRDPLRVGEGCLKVRPMDADVAIVGYGPVGATLANLLGVAGLSVAVIERYSEPYTLPRATHIDGEAMRVLQAAGLAEEVAPTLAPSARPLRFRTCEVKSGTY